jgi:glycosyltransferase involved in cell wall biosynthesis
MGSDVKKGSLLWHQIIKWFISKKWTATIVKSDDMKECLGISQLLVIPNGVDLRLFRPMDSAECRVKINWPLDKKIVVFAADPSRREKNYSLAEEAVKHIKRDDVLLKVANNVQHSDMPLYLNAADILVLTSSWEGSPNVVKEAMSCNTKIVAVKVGDIPWLLDGLENCYVTSHDPEDIASKIKQALDFRDKTKGRERLIELGLDSESVARRIVNVYERLMKEREL